MTRFFAQRIRAISERNTHIVIVCTDLDYEDLLHTVETDIRRYVDTK